jgi:glycosyltransferase involved in cell wall biosynthesis
VNFLENCWLGLASLGSLVDCYYTMLCNKFRYAPPPDDSVVNNVEELETRLIELRDDVNRHQRLQRQCAYWVRSEYGQAKLTRRLVRFYEGLIRG